MEQGLVINKDQVEPLGFLFFTMAQALMTDEEKEILSDRLGVSSIIQDPKTGEIKTSYNPYENEVLIPKHVLEDFAKISEFTASTPELNRQNRLLGARAVSSALYELSEEYRKLFAEHDGLKKAEQDYSRMTLYAVQKALRIIIEKMRASVAGDEVPQEYMAQLDSIDAILNPSPGSIYKNPDSE